MLVSVQSMTELKRAYTNYFLDMRKFTQIVEDSVGVSHKATPTTDEIPLGAQRKFPFMAKG